MEKEPVNQSLEISFNKNHVNENLKFFLYILRTWKGAAGEKSLLNIDPHGLEQKAWNGVLPYPHPSLDIITFLKGLCSNMEGMRRDLKVWLVTESSFV